MGIRSAIRKDAQAQGIDPQEGDILLRGTRVAIVARVTKGKVSWVDEEQGLRTEQMAEFKSRGLRRLQEAPEATFLDRAWQIASARDLPRAERIVALRGALSRATGDDAAQVIGWMAALSVGVEPGRMLS